MGARVREASQRSHEAWRDVGVFVSSTFTDMHAERGHLCKVVFPALRERLQRFRLNLWEVDLRWGITQNEIEHAGSLELCLQQIERCAPFFLALLGERYGWIPGAPSNRAMAKYPWLAEHQGKSITELEIRYAALDERISERSLFFFRDPQALSAIPEDIARAGYLEASLDGRQKLDALKQELLRGRHPVVKSYGARWSNEPSAPDGRGELIGLSEFGRAVELELWKAFSAHFGLDEAAAEAGLIDSARDEDYQHERFLESRRQVYVGRAEVDRSVSSALDTANGRWVVVSGSPGTGKSAVLANVYQSLAENFDLAVPHFVGATPASTSVVQSLRRFCRLLLHAAGAEDQIPASPDELISYFPLCLERLSRERTILLVVDGVEHFREALSGPLAWLPPVLPPNVAVLLSCTGGAPLEEAVRAGARVVELGELALEHRREVVERLPSLFGRTLDEERKSELLSNPATGNPLFLIVALEELRGVGTPLALRERILRLPRGGDAVVELFGQVVERLLHDFDSGLSSVVLQNLACARKGLSERELGALVALASGRDEHDDFFPLVRQLRPYLMVRGELLAFAHDQPRLAVEAALLADRSALDAVHDGLARHFLHRADPAGSRAWDSNDFRSLEELVFHLREAGRPAEVADLLTDPGFLEAFVRQREAVDRWGARYHEGVYVLLSVFRETIAGHFDRGGRAGRRVVPEEDREHERSTAPVQLTSLSLSKVGPGERGSDELERVATRLLLDIRDLGALSSFVRDEMDFIVDHKRAFRQVVMDGFARRFVAHVSGGPRNRGKPRIFLQDQRHAAFVVIARDIVEVLRTAREKPHFYGFPCWTSEVAAGFVHDVARMMLRRGALWEGPDRRLMPLEMKVLRDALPGSAENTE